jgi:RHS repeat-associated protein
MAGDPIMYDFQVLQTAFQTVKQLGEQVNKLGTTLTKVHNALEEHCSGDETGVGAVIAGAAKDVTGVAGKVFTEGGRVLAEMGSRGKTNGERTQNTDETIADSFKSLMNDGDGRNGAPRDGEPSAPGSGEPSPGTIGEPGSAPGSEAAQAARLSGEDGATTDPIDLVTGEMFLPQRDIELPGTLPLVLERRHGSGYRHGRLFGSTWASTLDQRVTVDADGIHFAAADGRVLHYPIPTVHGQRVLSSYGPRWPLAWDRKQDVIRIEQRDRGRVLHFPRGPVADSFRMLAVVTDRAGNRITVVCDDEAVPTDVYHSGGYHLRLGAVDTRGGVRIAAVRLADPAGGPDVPIREFRYDMAGRLIETVNAGSDVPLEFEYDAADRIVRWADRNGYEYRYHYREDGRVSHAEGTGGILNVDLDYDLDARTTTQTDALGNESVYHWNGQSQIVKAVDEVGGVTLTEKDRYGNVVASTDQLGRVTRIERNAEGDPLRVSRPDGSSVDVVYDNRRLPVRLTASDGGDWRYAYDERGALISVTDPTGAVTQYGRDERGALTSVSDPLGHTTSIMCDGAGLPVQITDPRGGIWFLRRDMFGRVTELIDPVGTSVRLEWDLEGRPRARRCADGSSETWEYDGEGNLLTYTSLAGAVTSFAYGPFDKPVERLEPGGKRHRFTYDAQLRLCAVAGPEDRTWRYEYDAAGRLIAETDFNGARRVFTLDAAGQVERLEETDGRSIALTRDAVGRVTERVAGQDVYRYAYDAAGRLARAEGPGTVLEYVRDPLGRVLSESLNGRAVVNQFDVAGRRTARATPGGVVSYWTYDEAGDVAALTGTGGSLAFAYDAAGRETNRVLGPRTSVTSNYDELGRLAGQGVWTYDHSEPAVVRAGTGADAGAAGSWRQVQARAYTYQADGLPTEVTDLLRGGTRSYTLNVAGRVIAVTGHSWQETYGYDALGNLALAEFPASSGATDDGDDVAAGVREFEGTLLRRAGSTRYEHDAAGRLVRKTRRTLSGQQFTTTYIWDAENRLAGVTTPRGEAWQYTYDALGRRVAKTLLTADGGSAETIWFTWDGSHLAEETRHNGGRVTTLTWDYESGRSAPAAQTRRSWATGASQVEIDTEFHAIVTDLVGAPQELVAPDGVVAWAGTETLWGVLTPKQGSTTDCPLRRPGQYHDAETGLYYNVYRYYDPETASYLTPDPLGLAPAPNPHAYVDNPLQEIDPLGLAPCSTGLTPEPDKALFWSGFGSGGDRTAEELARDEGLQSLGMMLADRGITPPASDDRVGWGMLSYEMANTASGVVYVAGGDYLQSSSIWARIEKPTLMNNPNVTSIISIDPYTGIHSKIFSH